MITIDFETRSAANLKKWGARRYALDTSTQALCLAWVYDQEAEGHLWHRDHPWIEKSPRPDELIERIRDGEPVEAHNAGFEFYIWNHTLRTEFPEFDVPLLLEQLHCSAAKASCMSLPRGLGEACDALQTEHRKIADGQRLINKLSKPMPSRSGGKGAGGLRHKTMVKRVLCNNYHPAQVLTYSDSDAASDYVLANYSVPPVGQPGASARDVLHRLRDIDGLLTGNNPFRWVAAPPQFEIDDPDPDQSMAVYVPAFCEEEAEHRKNWAYCTGDIFAERDLSNACPDMTPRERDYWLMDMRMNQRGVLLDYAGAEEALRLAKLEAERLNGELHGLTGGLVERGSQRKRLLGWTNERLRELQADTIENTRADTLSFALHGVPTKAQDEAKAAAKPASDAKWEAIGDGGEEVKRVLNICMEVNKTSVAKYKQMIDSVCPDDGRLHDIMLYNGADRTGRWSGKGVQPHNFVRGYSKEMNEVWEDIMALDQEGITLMWGEPMVALAKACRGALIAGPGNDLYAADFNAIEARKLAWMSGCTKLLDVFNHRDANGKLDGDPYIVMAEAIYKRKLNKKDNPNERNLGKKAILGLGYAMGWEKFQASVWADEGIWLEDEFCQEVVRVYRKEMYPEIPKLWKATGDAAIAAARDGGEHFCGGDEFGIGGVSYFMSDDGQFLHCRLPSGRLLAYMHPRVTNRVTYRFNALNARGKPTTVNFPAKKSVAQHRVRWHAEKLAEKQGKRLLGDPPESFVSPHLSFMGRDQYTKKWKRIGTHGGSLVENYDQASSRDLLAEAMYRVDDLLEFDLLLSIHDEVIAEGSKGACALKDFESIMAEVPAWAPGMPITAEGWIGERLRK